LQQSLSSVQKSPSWAPVHAPHTVVLVVHVDVAGSQQPWQQSASPVHAPPVATQVVPPGQQRSAPPAEGSGAHTPQQHTSPSAHGSLLLRQQMFAPPGPGWHMMFGNVSVQHGCPPVGLQPLLGMMHPLVPPRQRSMPVAVVSQPVRPPPFGQQLELAPPTHTSPAGMHDPAFAQRRIGRPSSVVPFCAHTPEQHCVFEVQSSRSIRQPPRYWQRGVPLPVESRHAAAQHDPPLTPSGAHGSPATPHAPSSAHVPEPPVGRSHKPLQH
jgi:hypothetical protein